MKAMLFVREVGQSKFVQENGDFPDEDTDGGFTPGASRAYAKGADMCVNGSVEAFQVWELSAEYQRTTKIEVQKS
jgi:hypothetical protein